MNQEKEYLEWIDIAKQDLNSAKYLMGMIPNPVEIICFHCQQSAEKYLKAFLSKNNEKILKTHDLTVLYLKCLNIDPAIEEIKFQCANLTNYSVNIRYPYHIELQENDAKKAIEDAKQIQKIIISKL